MKIVLQIIVQIFIFDFVSNSCSFGGGISHHPPKKFEIPIPPKLYNHSIDACPYYTGKPVCCDQIQQDQLSQNFQQIDFIFGDDCPICALNLKRFWCEYTCNPTQSEFIEALGYKNVIINKITYQALEMNWYLNPEFVCGLFQSCNKVPEVSEMSSNAMGFVQFLCDNAVAQGGTAINIIYSTVPVHNYNPLNYEIAKCNNDSNIIFNYTNLHKCSCSYCADSCNQTNITIAFPSFFYGFSPLFVIILYCILGVASFIIYLLKRVFSSTKNEELAPIIEESNLLNNINHNSQ